MDRNLAQLSDETFDVVVVGAGIYGACVARDASLRGLKVALVDSGDFGGATSHNSLKLVHGGMRYIQHLDFRRMRQSVNERRYWLTAAPHLVRPLKFVMPTFGHATRGREALWIAIKIHDIVGFDRNKGVSPERQLPRGSVVSAAECHESIPGIPSKNLTGGAIWYDGQIVDANRLLLECIMDAERAGAQVANYTKVVGLLGDESNVRGVQVVDQLNGARFDIRGRITINTCGPWVDTLLRLGPTRLSQCREIPQTKSMNFVTRRLFDDHAVGIISRRVSDSVIDSSGRMYFVTPWHDLSVIGTTHETFQDGPDNCDVSSDEIRDFLAEFSEACPAAQLQLEDVQYCYRGLTPGSEKAGRNDGQRSRHGALIDHQTKNKVAGLISVVGVKYTTARLVAEKAVDLAAKRLGLRNLRCRLQGRLLPGAVGYRGSNMLKQEIASALSGQTPDENRYLGILENYGARWSQLLNNRGGTDPEPRESVLQMVCRHAIEQEMAVKLEDVIFRRSSVAERGLLSMSIVRSCATMMRDLLGWSDLRMDVEITATIQKLEAAHALPSDAAHSHPPEDGR